MGLHWRRPFARLPRRSGVDRHGIHPVPSHRNGLAAERARDARDRRGARRRRHPDEQGGRAFHVRFHSGELQSADGRQRGGRLALHPGRQERAPSAGIAHPRSRRALHRARDQGRPRHAARRRVSRYFLDQKTAAERGGTHQAQTAEHVPPVQTTGRRRHHEGSDGGRPDHALHHGRSAGRCRYPDVECARAFRGRRMRRRDQRRQSTRRQFALRPLGFRETGRRVRGQVRARAIVRRNRPVGREESGGGSPPAL